MAFTLAFVSQSEEVQLFVFEGADWVTLSQSLLQMTQDWLSRQAALPWMIPLAWDPLNHGAELIKSRAINKMYDISALMFVLICWQKQRVSGQAQETDETNHNYIQFRSGLEMWTWWTAWWQLQAPICTKCLRCNTAWWQRSTKLWRDGYVSALPAKDHFWVCYGRDTDIRIQSSCTICSQISGLSFDTGRPSRVGPQVHLAIRDALDARLIKCDAWRL